MPPSAPRPVARKDELAGEGTARGLAPGGDIAALTGLRGVAALWVVLLHLTTTAPGVGLLTSPPTALRMGYIAVDLFFVLSGFVLGMTSLHRVSRDVRGETLPFLLARVFRLYPLHWCVLAAFVAYVLVLAPTQWATPHYAISKLLRTIPLLQVWTPFEETGWNPPAWSIAAEMVAYLGFAPLALVAVRVRRAGLALALALLSIAALALVMLATGSVSLDHIARLGLARCLTEFTAGVFLWRFVELGRARLAGDALFVAGVAIVGVTVLIPSIQLAVPLAFLCLVCACYASTPVPTALLGNRPVHFLGQISFSIYLIHFLVLTAFADGARALDLATAPLAARIFWLVAQLVATVAVACVTWRWIELPSQRLGKRLRRALEARRGARVAALGST